MSITFFVPGVPRPGGSKRAFYVPKLGRAVLTDASGQAGKDWRGDCKHVAQQHADQSLFGAELRLAVTFVMPRPRSHYRANGELKPNAPRWHSHKPDTTKLLRSIEDALTGILWRDDAQIVMQSAAKVYGERPGAHVKVTLARLSDEAEVTA